MRYPLTHVRRSIIKKIRNMKFWQECGDKGTLVHCWLDHNLVQALWITLWSFLKKLKIEVPYDPAFPVTGIYLKKTETLIWKIFIIPNSQATEATCKYINRWMDKEDMVWYIYVCVCVCVCVCVYHTHIYNAIIFRHKKQETLLLATTWMHLEYIMLSEISHTKTIRV